MFKKAFQHIVDTGRSLDVMCLSDKIPSEKVTWLPRFGQEHRRCGGSTSCAYRGYRNGSLTTFGQTIREIPLRVYSASGSTIPKIRFSSNELILHVDCYRVETIKSMPYGKKSQCRSCHGDTYPNQYTREACAMNLERYGV